MSKKQKLSEREWDVIMEVLKALLFVAVAVLLHHCGLR